MSTKAACGFCQRIARKRHAIVKPRYRINRVKKNKVEAEKRERRRRTDCNFRKIIATRTMTSFLSLFQLCEPKVHRHQRCYGDVYISIHRYPPDHALLARVRRARVSISGPLYPRVHDYIYMCIVSLMVQQIDY